MHSLPLFLSLCMAAVCTTADAAQRAAVGRPAPAWSGQAVVDGEIKTISLKDYRGVLCFALLFAGVHGLLAGAQAILMASSSAARELRLVSRQLAGKYLVLFFYPARTPPAPPT
jgi:alkyl hydroperoxide reductase subunit AhpC